MTMMEAPMQDLSVADLDQRFDQLKQMVTTLRSRNSILADENNSLKTQIEAIRSEMGGRLFDARAPVTDLVKTVDKLRETLAKKLDGKSARELAAGKPLRIVVAEVGNSASEKLAKELLEMGDMPLSAPRLEDL